MLYPMPALIEAAATPSIQHTNMCSQYLARYRDNIPARIRKRKPSACSHRYPFRTVKWGARPHGNLGPCAAGALRQVAVDPCRGFAGRDSGLGAGRNLTSEKLAQRSGTPTPPLPGRPSASSRPEDVPT